MRAAGNASRRRRLRHEAEGGGGGTPEWLPAGALAYADFSAGHYYASGAETTAAAMFVEDTDYGSWNAATIVPGSGIVDTTYSHSPNLANDVAAALIASGFTTVMDFTLTASGAVALLMSNASFSSSKAGIGEGSGGAFIATPDGGYTPFDGPTGTARAAITIVHSGGISISINGGAVKSLANVGAWVPTLINLNVAQATLAAVTFYAPISDAALPQL